MVHYNIGFDQNRSCKVHRYGIAQYNIGFDINNVIFAIFLYFVYFLNEPKPAN